MNTRKTHLKVKIKSLAAESKIIRLEELRSQDRQLKNSLYFHRVNAVRSESRTSQLAYAFLRGREYGDVEQKCSVAPDFVKIQSLVERFGACYDIIDVTCLRYDNDISKKYEEAKRCQNAKFLGWLKRAQSHLSKQTFML